MKRGLCIAGAVAIAVAGLINTTTFAAPDDGPGPGACKDLPSHAELKTALTAARNQANGGFNLDMWASVAVDEILSTIYEKLTVKNE